MNSADTIRVQSTIPSTSKETMLSNFTANFIKISRFSKKIKNSKEVETKNSTFFLENKKNLENDSTKTKKKGWFFLI